MSGSAPQKAGGGGRRWLKAVLLTLLIAVGIVVLFTWVFPWVEELTQDPTIGAQLFRLPR
ncbi:MAG: hypothetical protein R6U94_06395 [Nitriliruptoraceae bacterium]